MTPSSPSQPDNWHPGDQLTQIEKKMRRAAATGGLVDCAMGPFNLAAKEGWGPDRTVRASVLRHLLIEVDWPVHAKGVHLRGVRISGQLDLEAATLRCPLRLERCYFPEPVPVNFSYATASLLSLTDCHLAGLRGNALVVTKDLDLSRSTFKSQLQLLGANITGQFVCRFARLTSVDADTFSALLSLPGGLDALNALNADNIRVGGDVFLNRMCTTRGAVRLVGADIAGQLDCSAAKLTGVDDDDDALIADNIRVGGDAFLNGELTASGAIRLAQAHIAGQLNCGGARLNGVNKDRKALVADGIHVGGDALLNEKFAASGAIQLSQAHISGQLNCSGAQLSAAPNSDCYALIAFRMEVGGDVFLDRDEADDGKFTAAGAIRLSGAKITGQLNCSGAQLTGVDEQGNVLAADGITVGHHVILDKKFTAKGAVLLNGADITGQLRFHDATLSAGRGSGGRALIANGMKVGGDVFLDQDFIATGTLSLRSVRVDGSLTLMPLKLHDKALDLSEAHISHELHWEPREPVAGRVILEDAVVGELQDFWTGANGKKRSNGFWPDANKGALRLDGFTYARIGGEHPATPEQRLAWLGSPKKRARNREGRFATQPYEQLAKVYEQAGQDKEARQVAIARRRDLRRYGDLSGLGRFANWLLDFTIQYGYQTSRAIGGIIILYLLVLGFLLIARDHNALIPVQTIVGLASGPDRHQLQRQLPVLQPVRLRHRHGHPNHQRSPG